MSIAPFELVQHSNLRIVEPEWTPVARSHDQVANERLWLFDSVWAEFDGDPEPSN